jgi:protein involved in polysaccharide export with SLBB domain
MLLAALALPVAGQEPGDASRPVGPPPPVTAPGATQVGAVATRADLQRDANTGGAVAASARERLANGDFQPGDRIALFVQGEPTLTDTVAVRAGQILHLPNLPDITLHGVLRSELQDYLTHELGRYLRNPVVRAVPLVRIAVLGPVFRPGYYSAPADELVSDVVMQAGGLTPTADMDKTTVHRGAAVIAGPTDVRAALARGATLDQLDVRAGDQIVIGERPPGGNFLRVLGIVSAIVGVGVGVALIAKH